MLHVSDFLSFHLSDDFLEPYKTKRPDWGFDIGGGNSLAEMTFITKYSRLKEDGSKERWWEVCQRCIEGYYSILKDHCISNKTAWNEWKAQKAARDAYERMFAFKWMPPGRGLWAMGTEFVNGRGDSSPLQNCSFLSSEKLSTHSVAEATMPFVRLMEMSMLGIGVGFDTRGAGKLTFHAPVGDPEIWQIPDTREGWADSVQKQLETFFFKNRRPIQFDYSLIRPAGEPIKGFGGTAAGPQPLIDLHDKLDSLYADREGTPLTAVDIADICNLIAKAVVAGGVRRSALIALGNQDDDDFLNLKNYDVFPERNGPDGWGWSSNNSIFADVDGDYGYLVDRIADNGEPGMIFLDLARSHGRLADVSDGKDWRASGSNPCGEILLESGEMCTLVETFPHHHDSLEDFQQTLKHAYLYGKAVTLLPTHWPETNEVMQRNRRIGCSVSGLSQFVEARSWTTLRTWLDAGFHTVQERDRKYSEWLGVRESIRTTTVKPSGTVSLVAGATPGVHWPVAAGVYNRRVRFANVDPMLELIREAGYHVEPDVMDPKSTSVATFPTRGPDVREETSVSVWEKAELAVLCQRWWSNNMVSCTLTFNQDEKDQLPALISAKAGQLKTMSLLPKGTETYAQMPYEAIEGEINWDDYRSIDWDAVYAQGQEAEGEKFCTTDKCEVVF